MKGQGTVGFLGLDVMKELVASHSQSVFLKPGEVVVTRTPLLVSTVLGSCVTVTMYSPLHGIGAICHAMLPRGGDRDNDLRYVDTALLHIYRKLAEYGAGRELEVKLFGGAQLLEAAKGASAKRTVGAQNVARARAVLASLGLTIVASDTGGFRGRKLFFCTRSGDVYVRRMHHRKSSGSAELTL